MGNKSLRMDFFAAASSAWMDGHYLPIADSVNSNNRLISISDKFNCLFNGSNGAWQNSCLRKKTEGLTESDKIS